MDVRVGLWRTLSTEELMLFNCGVGEDSWESLGLQGDPSSPFWRRSALGFLWINDAKAETPILWPPHAKSWLIGKDWCWEGLGAGAEGYDRGWDGWMASLTRWMWVWVNSRSWWWTGRPGVLWFMGSQRVEHDWVTDLIWSDQVLNTPSLKNAEVEIQINRKSRIYKLKCLITEICRFLLFIIFRENMNN